MELNGVGYVIDHCISYFYKEQRHRAYEVYVTDVLRIISENTAKQVGGSYVKARYAEIIDPPKEETRTADQIIDNIRSKLEGK